MYDGLLPNCVTKVFEIEVFSFNFAPSDQLNDFSGMLWNPFLQKQSCRVRLNISYLVFLTLNIDFLLVKNVFHSLFSLLTNNVEEDTSFALNSF